MLDTDPFRTIAVFALLIIRWTCAEGAFQFITIEVSAAAFSTDFAFLTCAIAVEVVLDVAFLRLCFRHIILLHFLVRVAESISECVEVFERLFFRQFRRYELSVSISRTGQYEQIFGLLHRIHREHGQEAIRSHVLRTEAYDDRSKDLNRP